MELNVRYKYFIPILMVKMFMVGQKMFRRLFVEPIIVLPSSLTGLECTDLSGLPVAGVSVYNSQSAGGIFINPAITNSAGIATGELYPMKTQIWVNNPITNEIASDSVFC